MNERIKELAEQAWDSARDEIGSFVDDGGKVNWDFLHTYDKKFADLIIAECLSLGNVLSKHYINTHPEQKQAWLLASIADYKNEIKKHFGVEE